MVHLANRWWGTLAWKSSEANLGEEADVGLVTVPLVSCCSTRICSKNSSSFQLWILEDNPACEECT